MFGRGASPPLPVSSRILFPGKRALIEQPFRPVTPHGVNLRIRNYAP